MITFQAIYMDVIARLNKAEIDGAETVELTFTQAQFLHDMCNSLSEVPCLKLGGNVFVQVGNSNAPSLLKIHEDGASYVNFMTADEIDWSEVCRRGEYESYKGGEDLKVVREKGET